MVLGLIATSRTTWNDNFELFFGDSRTEVVSRALDLDTNVIHFNANLEHKLLTLATRVLSFRYFG